MNAEIIVNETTSRDTKKGLKLGCYLNQSVRQRFQQQRI